MEQDLILDRAAAPDMDAITAYVQGEANTRFQALTAYLADTFGVKPLIAYSVCSGKPGWNVKYKKSGRALCTLYPEKDSFIALVVLNGSDRDKFEAVRPAYTPYLQELYSGCTLFNGTKWLMIRVSDDAVLSDVQNLLNLKLAK